VPSDPDLVIAALLGTTTWSLFAYGLRIPTSYSQTLVGSLIGAAWVSIGRDAIVASGLTIVLLGLFLSPILGLVASFSILKLIYFLSALAGPTINRWFNRGQVLLSFMLALSFGANDGQKVMAVISLGLVTTGVSSSFSIPFWVIVISAIAIASGALIGGHQLIRTLGLGIYKIRPIEGFGAQLSASSVMLVASIVGAPVSGTQITTMSIVGAGSADRFRKIRWLTVRHILTGWLLTMPSAIALSAGFYKLIEGIS
jgi:PiT family inorganic phosphate transporter